MQQLIETTINTSLFYEESCDLMLVWNEHSEFDSLELEPRRIRLQSSRYGRQISTLDMLIEPPPFLLKSYKMINSGEGGFLSTAMIPPDIAAKAAVYAGAYKGLAGKHITVPEPKHFKNKNYPNEIPNYSLRMSALAAAVVRPQIKTLDARREKYNQRYAFVTEKLVERKGHLLSIPVNTPGKTPVHDSLQFNLSHDITDEQVQAFLDECAKHGLPVELFGHKSNARNFVNWGFAPADDPLPLTAKMLSRACDVRLPLMWDDADFEDMVDVLCESLKAAVEN